MAKAKSTRAAAALAAGDKILVLGQPGVGGTVEQVTDKIFFVKLATGIVLCFTADQIRKV